MIKDAVKDFEAHHPGVKVKVVGGINDDKIIAASRGGKAPDVAQSFSADNAGAFCGSGAWIDLKPYIERDGISDTIFPPAPRSYTQFEGKRCALPMLADALRPLLQQGPAQEGGAQRPAEDVSRAHRVREEADRQEPRRLAQGRRLRPDHGLLREHARPLRRRCSAPSGSTTTASRALGSDPAWQKLLNWQKDLIDWYGYDKLVKFQAGLGDEFSRAERVREGQGRDEHGRRVAHRVHRRRGAEPQLRHRAVPVDDANPTSTAAATSPATSSASRSAPSTRRRAGRCSST